jgi:bacterioferritin (cytochrome b1)
MPVPDTIAVLNRVFAILEKSFPQYARWARPYVPPGRERAVQTLQDIAIAEESLAHQVSDEIIALGGRPDSGDFSMDFTDTHDLGIDYMVAEAIGYQKQDLAELEVCVERLAGAPAAHALVEEVLNLARRHLQHLEELPIRPGSSTSFGANGAATKVAPISDAPSAPTHQT